MPLTANDIQAIVVESCRALRIRLLPSLNRAWSDAPDDADARKYPGQEDRMIQGAPADEATFEFVVITTYDLFTALRTMCRERRVWLDFKATAYGNVPDTYDYSVVAKESRPGWMLRRAR